MSYTLTLSCTIGGAEFQYSANLQTLDVRLSEGSLHKSEREAAYA